VIFRHALAHSWPGRLSFMLGHLPWDYLAWIILGLETYPKPWMGPVCSLGVFRKLTWHWALISFLDLHTELLMFTISILFLVASFSMSRVISGGSWWMRLSLNIMKSDVLLINVPLSWLILILYVLIDCALPLWLVVGKHVILHRSVDSLHLIYLGPQRVQLWTHEGPHIN
jgi:hypothetical protein